MSNARGPGHSVARIALLLAAAALAPERCLAQAWVAPRGEASVALGYEFVSVHHHLFDDGVPLDLGRIYSQSVSTSLGYAATDRVSLSLALPYVVARYAGNKPHDPNGVVTLDDGSYHGAFQDFHVEARVQAVKGALAVTPFVGVVLPSHSYEYFGHAVVGKDLKELQVGVNAGRRLDPFLPDAYAHVRYGFSVPERVLGISHDRSNVDLELGYFATSALTLRALGFWQVTHGGFRSPVDDLRTRLDFVHHDQLDRNDFLQLGLGASYALTRSVDGYATFFKTLSGRNGHKIAGAVGVGLAMNFSPAQLLRGMRHRDGPEPAAPAP